MYLVTGATGNVGTEVARTLAETGHPARGLTRNDRTANLPGNVEPVPGDLNQPDTLKAALAGVHGVFLLPGYEDMPGVLAAAKTAGVQHVVQLSGASAATGDMTNAITAYMVRSEEAVRDAGVPWTILRPSAFMSNALRWADQVRTSGIVTGPFGDIRTAVIDPADIAAVAATALTEPGHNGQIYRLTGPESLRPADQIRILSDVLGRPLGFDGQSNDEARAEMTAAMPVEYVDAFFNFYVDGTLDESPVYPTVQQITRRQPRTFAEWAAAHAPAFR